MTLFVISLGLTGEANVQGEDVKKLDVLANDIFRNSLIASGKVSLLVSEEDEHAMVVENPEQRGKYIVTFDPLDGSSNIDCGVSIGTIFGIFRVVGSFLFESEVQVRHILTNLILQQDGEEVGMKDLIRSGRNMVAAGYCMYGSYCEMILVRYNDMMRCLAFTWTQGLTFRSVPHL
jgi:fructose-1,6-bisphosphatase I